MTGNSNLDWLQPKKLESYKEWCGTKNPQLFRKKKFGVRESVWSWCLKKDGNEIKRKGSSGGKTCSSGELLGLAPYGDQATSDGSSSICYSKSKIDARMGCYSSRADNIGKMPTLQHGNLVCFEKLP